MARRRSAAPDMSMDLVSRHLLEAGGLGMHAGDALGGRWVGPSSCSSPSERDHDTLVGCACTRSVTADPLPTRGQTLVVP
jgi:hypothetical protein